MILHGPSEARPPIVVAVDGRELLGRSTGVGRYLWHVLDEWARTPGVPLAPILIVPSEPPASLRAEWPRLPWIVEAGSGSGTLWEQTKLARAADRSGAEVLFAPAYTAPLRTRCRVVVAIHDLSYFSHPEWFSMREGTRRRWLTRASAARADAIVTVSAFSAGEIVRWLRVPAAKVHVTYHGAPPIAGLAGVTREPLVLYVGSLFERRHLAELVAAFAIVLRRRPDARLLVIGEDRGRTRIDPEALARGHGISHAVAWRPYVPHDELMQSYARARAFVFLSDYEGFALTPLEAIAHGVPPVLLDTAVGREVYDDAARYVSLAPTVVADAISDLLDDGPLRSALCAAGRGLLGRYSWTRTAAETLAVITAVARR
jgi:glycosyltransferase involved in cell wall biosynthesis